MAIAGKRLLLSGVLVLLAGAAMQATAQAASPGSITVTPAAVRLELAKGSTVATATVNITNNYSSDMALHFAFEKPRQNTGATDTARAHLLFNDPDATIAAGATYQQVITLNDAANITPGSQPVDMVVTHSGLPGQGIGVLPSMRLPLTVIKQDGAVTSLGLTNIAGPSVAMRIPATITVTLRNTGNMIAIPRGVVMVQSPSGNLLASGVLNEASLAVTPGAGITLTAKLTRLGSATLPGSYSVHVAYGLGGDSAAAHTAKQFIFVAWWQPLAVLAAAAAGWYLVSRRNIFHPPKKRPQHLGRAAPKRPVLIGRDIA
ncbi:MAG TPA: hypothetical protein VGO07_04155 [Candidatus Saccharimonadales bacterium]|jgi:hypothetical protein|nr:hypothetical protein [Candidatus Saccharimonadales bacterium]